MKKFLAAVLTVFLGASSVFAIENSFDANFAVPLYFSAEKTSNTLLGVTTIKEVDKFWNGFGLVLNDTAMLTKNLGARISLGLLWPYEVQIKTITNTSSAYGNTTTTNTNKGYFKDDGSIFNANLFVGFTYRPVLDRKFQVLITPGANFSWINAVLNVDNEYTSNFTFGLGVEVTGEYNVYKDLYVSISVPFVYQFVSVDNGKTDENYKGSLRVTPQIGAGWRF